MRTIICTPRPIDTTEELVHGHAVGINELTALHPAIRLRLIRRMIGEVRGTSDISAEAAEAAEAIAREGRTGSGIDIYGRVRGICELRKARYRAEKRRNSAVSYRLMVGESRYIPELGATVHAETADRRDDTGEFFSVPDRNDPRDAELEIRSRRPGDRFVPWGMDGTKKTQGFHDRRKDPA